jgi:hypothetical protein
MDSIGIEPTTSSVSRKRSPPELTVHNMGEYKMGPTGFEPVTNRMK